MNKIKKAPANDIKPLIRKDYESVHMVNDPYEGRDLARETNPFIITFSDSYTVLPERYKGKHIVEVQAEI